LIYRKIGGIHVKYLETAGKTVYSVKSLMKHDTDGFLKRLNLKQLVIILLITTIFVLFIIFHSELGNIFQRCFSVYGFLGLALFVLIMDILVQPISPDIVIFGSALGGANIILTALIGGFSSITAGIAGYFIGRKLISTGAKGIFSANHLRNGERLFNRYGKWAVAIGALTPVPFSAVCWSAGLYHMRFHLFLITSLLTRIPRFFIMSLIGSIFSAN